MGDAQERFFQDQTLVGLVHVGSPIESSANQRTFVDFRVEGKQRQGEAALPFRGTVARSGVATLLGKYGQGFVLEADRVDMLGTGDGDRHRCRVAVRSDEKLRVPIGVCRHTAVSHLDHAAILHVISHITCKVDLATVGKGTTDDELHCAAARAELDCCRGDLQGSQRGLFVFGPQCFVGDTEEGQCQDVQKENNTSPL